MRGRQAAVRVMRGRGVGFVMSIMPSRPCEQGRRRSSGKECGAGQICEHGRRRSNCKKCGGSGVCEHGRRRSSCKECKSIATPTRDTERCRPAITALPRQKRRRTASAVVRPSHPERSDADECHVCIAAPRDRGPVRMRRRGHGWHAHGRAAAGAAVGCGRWRG